MTKIKIIDLFAGPGGLGEGFASFKAESNSYPFEIVASVEKEPSAHKTLQLRSFFRKFQGREVPNEYYTYVKGEGLSIDELFGKFPVESKAAIEETMGRPMTLGDDNGIIHEKIQNALKECDALKVVIGGPPCQAYSLVGRARNKGNQSYVAEEDNRHFLYKEYLKILNLVQPDVFVMENVKGILSSTLNDEKIFPRILDDLMDPGKALGGDSTSIYKIYSLVAKAEMVDGFPQYNDHRDFIIRCEKYGIPQARHRVILLGVRSEISKIPGVLEEKDPVSVKDVIGELPKLRSGLSKEVDTEANWSLVVSGTKAQLIMVLRKNGQKGFEKYLENDKTNYSDLQRGGRFISTKKKTLKEKTSLFDWFYDSKLNGVLNHETRGHIKEDLQRYLFCAHFAKFSSDATNKSPKNTDFPSELAPNHANWGTGKFSDRFRVQLESRYSTTITSHISKDGHYFIHYDPRQCRSLTVREAARLQTFPDNYFFEGNRTQQYVQVGNAVPPYLAKQIAHVVYMLLHTQHS